VGGARRRRRSADHERLWFSLAATASGRLRYPLDDWRVRQLWSLYGQGVQYIRMTELGRMVDPVAAVAGGLDRGAGAAGRGIAERVASPDRQDHGKQPGIEDMARLAACWNGCGGAGRTRRTVAGANWRARRIAATVVGGRPAGDAGSAYGSAHDVHRGSGGELAGTGTALDWKAVPRSLRRDSAGAVERRPERTSTRRCDCGGSALRAAKRQLRGCEWSKRW